MYLLLNFNKCQPIFFVILVKENLFDYPFMRLKFYGIDTVASVYLNEKCIAKSSNMFTSLSIPVHSLLLSNNKLELKFESPTLYAKNQSDLYLKKFGYKIPPVVAPPAQHGRDHPNFIRKEQCSFSWVRYFKPCSHFKVPPFLTDTR